MEKATAIGIMFVASAAIIGTIVGAYFISRSLLRYLQRKDTVVKRIKSLVLRYRRVLFVCCFATFGLSAGLYLLNAHLLKIENKKLDMEAQQFDNSRLQNTMSKKNLNSTTGQPLTPDSVIYNAIQKLNEQGALSQYTDASGAVIPSSLLTDTSKPDEAAEVQRLAKRTGLSPDLVRRNLPEVRRRVKVDDIQQRHLQLVAPGLFMHLSDPNFANVAPKHKTVLASILEPYLYWLGIAFTAVASVLLIGTTCVIFRKSRRGKVPAIRF